MGPRPHLWFFAFKTTTLAPEIQVSMDPSPHLWLCAFTTATLWPELIDSMGPIPHLSLCACKTAWLATELLVSVGPSPHLLFLNAKQGFWVQNYKSLWFPYLTYVFCIQNSDFRTRIAGLYGFQPSSVVFASKTVTLGPELQVSLGPRPHQWFFAFKTATLASELLVSIGPSPHLWLLQAKQWLWVQNYKSLLVPYLTYVFCIQNSDFSIRITSLYWSQPSFVAFASKTVTLGPKLQVSMGPRPHQWLFAFKTAALASESLVSMGPSPPWRLVQAKQWL